MFLNRKVFSFTLNYYENKNSYLIFNFQNKVWILFYIKQIRNELFIFMLDFRKKFNFFVEQLHDEQSHIYF